MESSPITFTTFANACEDQTSINYNGVDYDIVTLGNQCWFAENLRTDQLNDGTPIVDGTFDDSIWESQGNSMSPVFAFNNWSGQVDFDNSILGNVYNGWAVQTEKLCPTGWRVSSHWDWAQVDEITGKNTRQKLLAVETDPRGNSYRSGGIKGTDLYGFGMQVNGALKLEDGQNYGFVGLSYWTKNHFSETAYGGPMPSGKVLVADLAAIRATASHEDADREMRTYYLGKQERNENPSELLLNASDAFEFGRGQMVRCVKGPSAPDVIIGNMQPLYHWGGQAHWRADYCNFDITANVDNGQRDVMDECGVCGGTGIPIGFCDCEGNIEDAIGICG